MILRKKIVHKAKDSAIRDDICLFLTRISILNKTWLKSKILKIPIAGKDVAQQELSSIAGETIK